MRWLFGVLLAGLLVAVTPAEAAKRIALVIGNDGYQAVGALRNPVQDAKLIADTLDVV